MKAGRIFRLRKIQEELGPPLMRPYRLQFSVRNARLPRRRRVVNQLHQRIHRRVTHFKKPRLNRLGSLTDRQVPEW